MPGSNKYFCLHAKSINGERENVQSYLPHFSKWSGSASPLSGHHLSACQEGGKKADLGERDLFLPLRLSLFFLGSCLAITCWPGPLHSSMRLLHHVIRNLRAWVGVKKKGFYWDLLCCNSHLPCYQQPSTRRGHRGLVWIGVFHPRGWNPPNPTSVCFVAHSLPFSYSRPVPLSALQLNRLYDSFPHSWWSP